MTIRANDECPRVGDWNELIGAHLRIPNTADIGAPETLGSNADLVVPPIGQRAGVEGVGRL